MRDHGHVPHHHHRATSGAHADTGTDRRAEIDLPPEPASVRVARGFVVRHCHDAGINGDTRETTVLLTSEVVTNAVVHGHGRARLAFSSSRTHVTVEVGDETRRMPERGTPSPEALGGRGLAIVDELASRWGAREDGAGKVVWFEVARRADSGG